MRHLLFIFLTSMLSVGAFSQSRNIDSFLEQNIQMEIIKRLGDQVDLYILDKHTLASKTQAKGILDDFFKKHPPVKFIPRHQGNPNSPRKFGVGRLETENGNFRFSYVMEKTQKNPKVRQIRIHRATPYN